MSHWIRVAKTDELYPETGTLVYADGHPIALFAYGGSYFALDDTCTHSGGPLFDGLVKDGVVECPWHGARFELDTGKVVRPPAVQEVRRYRIRVDGEDILIEVP